MLAYNPSFLEQTSFLTQYPRIYTIYNWLAYLLFACGFIVIFGCCIEAQIYALLNDKIVGICIC